MRRTTPILALAACLLSAMLLLPRHQSATQLTAIDASADFLHRPDGRTRQQWIAFAAEERAQTAAYLSAIERQRIEQQRAADQARQGQHRQAAKPRRTQRVPHTQRHPQAVQSGGSVSGNWSALINQYPWDHSRAYRIMMCESHGNPRAYNGKYGATGLFQILHGPFDPAANVAQAFRMYQASGWKPWNASRHCWG